MTMGAGVHQTPASLSIVLLEIELDPELRQPSRHDHLRLPQQRAESRFLLDGRVVVEQVVQVEHPAEAEVVRSAEDLRQPQVELSDSVSEDRTRSQDVDRLLAEYCWATQDGGDLCGAVDNPGQSLRSRLILIRGRHLDVVRQRVRPDQFKLRLPILL